MTAMLGKMSLAAVVLIVTLAAARCDFVIKEDIYHHPNFNLLYKIPHRNESCGVPPRRRFPEPRVMGGEDTYLGEFPWMARLELHDSSTNQIIFKCGGVIISDQYILTAAHCEPKTGFHVRVGEHDERFEKDCDGTGFCLPPPQVTTVASYVCHQDYVSDLSGLKNDICILRLAKKLKFNDSVRPICLPWFDLEQYRSEREELTVAGWGYYKYEVRSPVLLKTTVLPLDRKTCNASLNQVSASLGSKGMFNVSHPGQICTKGKDEKSACHGDSGGPLMQNIRYPKGEVTYLKGIVSFGINYYCRFQNAPAVYADVHYYIKWVLDNLPTN